MIEVLRHASMRKQHCAPGDTASCVRPDDATQCFVGTTNVSHMPRAWVRGDGALSAAALRSRPVAGTARADVVLNGMAP
jgi:hypothetical protein